MAGAPLPTTGSVMTRERSRLLHFDLHFYIEGPKNEGDEEPWDQLVEFAPSSTPFNLPEVGRSATKQDDGDWLLVIHVEGLPANDKGLLVLEIDHAGSEDPIESAPQFLGPNGIGKKWGAQFDGEKFNGWKRMVKDPETGQTVPNPYYGQTHFINDGAILRVSFITAKFDQRILWNIAKIDDSLVPDAAKQFLVKQGNQTWLKRSVKGSFRGNVWQFDIEWLLGVWAPDLYSPKVTGQPLPDVQSAELISTSAIA